MESAERTGTALTENHGLKRALDRLERLTHDIVKRPAEEVAASPEASGNPVHDMQRSMRDAFVKPAAPAATEPGEHRIRASSPAAEAPVLLSMKQAAAITTLSVSSIKRMMAAGTFPQPVRLGESRIAFVDSEIHAWIRQRIAARR
jgi:predicted DNA-binding transcriptional regulator AlpA